MSIWTGLILIFYMVTQILMLETCDNLEEFEFEYADMHPIGKFYYIPAKIFAPVNYGDDEIEE